MSKLCRTTQPLTLQDSRIRAIPWRGKRLAVCSTRPFMRLGDQHDGCFVDRLACRTICSICSGPERRVDRRAFTRRRLRGIPARGAGRRAASHRGSRRNARYCRCTCPRNTVGTRTCRRSGGTAAATATPRQRDRPACSRRHGSPGSGVATVNHPRLSASRSAGTCRRNP
jgi:hypothetical protein